MSSGERSRAGLATEVIDGRCERTVAGATRPPRLAPCHDTRRADVSQNPNVAERTPGSPVELSAVGDRLLDEARANANGRSAVTLTPSEGGPLKQTLLAIAGGRELAEHPAPGPSSIQIVRGAGVLTCDGNELRLTAGQWAPVPLERHTLRAEEDLVALLTVAPTG
jgi:quercetin dioxygenase-like cupin family protein